MFRWFRRKCGMTVYSLVEGTYLNAGKNGFSATSLTKCGTFGNQDVLIIVAIGDSAKVFKNFYDKQPGESKLVWSSKEEE